MDRLEIDFETYSPVNLRAAGAYAYAERAEILMCGWSYGGPAEVAVGEEAVARIPGLWDPEVTVVAHNAPFERVILSARAAAMGQERWLTSSGFLAPHRWQCTMARARLLDMPASLGELAEVLGAKPKDTAGTALIRRWTMPNAKTGRLRPEDDPESWEAFLRYCANDVDTLVEIDTHLPEWGWSEHQLWIVDQLINDRGIRVDRELAQAALDADARLKQEGIAELGRLLGVANGNSRAQILAALHDLGAALPNLRSETVKAWLDLDELPEVARQALRLRQEVSLTSASKYKAAVAGVSADGRLRGQFMYHGAHTGRWSGRGVQLQNLPRAYDPAAELSIVDVKAGLPVGPQTLKALIRPMLLGPFVVADYAAIEARVIAWLSGEQWALEAFELGRDIYVETAERMSPEGGPALTRQQGKVAVLALGFQGGVNALRRMGGEGTDDELDALKVQWRLANQRIVQWWADLDEAFRNGGTAGRVSVRPYKGRRRIVLPSGRELNYWGVRQERWVLRTEDPVTGEVEVQEKAGLRYRGAKGKRTPIYGGLAAENVTQAVARDVLADALRALEAAGVRVVGHVHDEVICEDVDDLEQVTELMCRRPPGWWSDGLPLSAEAFRTDRYTKADPLDPKRFAYL